MHHRGHAESLAGLSPVKAVQAWLDGKFGIDDEDALIDAIRQDKRIILSDDEITDVVCDAMEEGITAEECLDRLRGIG